MPLDQETMLKQTSTPVSSHEHWKYSGLTGALQYGLLTAALAAVASVAGALAVWYLTKNFELSRLVALRLLGMGTTVGSSIVLASWLLGWRQNRLLYLKPLPSDYIALLGLLIGYSLTLGLLFQNAPSSPGPFPDGMTLEIEGPTVDGGSFAMSDVQGKVLLIDFWATWCGPCVAELPNIRRAYDNYHEQGLDVVGISLDDDKGSLAKFLEKHDEPWPQIFSEEPGKTGFNNPLAKSYGINSIPSIHLVDQQGKILASGIRGDGIDRAIAKALDLPGPTRTWSDLVSQIPKSLAMSMFMAIMNGPWWLSMALCSTSTCILVVFFKLLNVKRTASLHSE